jgi:PAS domain S-box-containing protein
MTDKSNDLTETKDFSDCEREAIHIPGSIQPFGALICVNLKNMQILQVSENIQKFLNISPEKLINKNLKEFFNDKNFNSLLETTLSEVESTKEQVHAFRTFYEFEGFRKTLNIIPHTQNNLMLLDIEEHSDLSQLGYLDFYRLTSNAILTLMANRPFEELIQIVSQEIKGITGFDRVMVYRFDRDWNGEVVAEAKNSEMESYLNLRYPASDIPKQARELYQKNLIRFIPDINYTPSYLKPIINPETKRPLDLTLSQLRSVSPIHIEYVKNMQVESTLTLSIIVNGELWGLIACHNKQPGYISAENRLACLLIAKCLASQIEILESKKAQHFELMVKSFENNLRSCLTNDTDIKEELKVFHKDLLDLVKADGFALMMDGQLMTFGETPAESDITALITFISESTDHGVFFTESLSKDYKNGEKIKDTASGVFAVPVGMNPLNYVIWFRKEYSQVVKWGGDPNAKVVRFEDGKLKIYPRTSFALWKDSVKSKSLSWSDQEIKTAKMIASSIWEIVDKYYLQESEDRFRSMAEQSPFLIWLSDPDGKRKYFNKAWLNFTGKSTEEEIDFGWLELIHPDDVENYKKIYNQAMISQEAFKFEYRLLKKEGDYRWVSVMGVPRFDADGRFKGFVGCSTDVSEYKDNEQKLILSKELAEAANRAKTDFLANMSHEIRTPLNGLLGMNSLLEQTKLTDEQKEFVQTIHSSSQALLAIINDILDFSKIEAGKLQIESMKFDLIQLIGEIKDFFQSKANEKGICLKIDTEKCNKVIVIGDPFRLRQVLLNLLTNALKFTSKGSIRLDIESLENSLVKFTCTDTGIGIPKDKLEEIFEKFTQVDTSTTRKYGGTGLGLAICKQLLELMNGEIFVESEMGKGSSFWFILPLPGIEERKEINSAKKSLLKIKNNSQNLGRKKVLLVEDNPINQKVTIKLLQKLECEIELAENGHEAIRKLQGNDFDLILMDCQMPEMDGYQATSIIKKSDKKHIPIIALTAHALPGDREKCLNSGMNDYLAKPVELENLKAILDLWTNN